MMDRDERAKLDEIVGRHDGDASHLLAILQDIQDERNYLPRAWLEELAARLSIPMTKIYRTASFFKALSLKPRGRRIVTVCVGTTCHVRGAPKLVDKVGRDYAIKPGETTADMGLTLETVGCVGACALGPLVVIDGKYHGHMTGEKLGKALGKSAGEHQG
jgi:NADH-quinone oxidoreductase subunit E